MAADRTLIIAGAGALAVAALGLYVARKGGISAAASSVGAGTVNAVGGAMSGAVGAVGAAVGLPTPAQTTTDAEVARWLIDHAGHFEASKWAGAPAYLRALVMEPGTGRPPPAGSPAAVEFAALIANAAAPDTGDETARLARRYPQPITNEPSTIFSGEGSFQDLVTNPPTWGVTGSW